MDTEYDYYSKHCEAYTMICDDPGKWFGGARIDDKDRALLTGSRASFVKYWKGSFVQNMYYKEKGHGFTECEWTVEEDDECKRKVQSAGGQLFGFDLQPFRPTQWSSMNVNVLINGAASRNAGFDAGIFSTAATNVRVFRGPPETCNIHPWDAMILRDCTPNSTNLYDIEAIASRKWDILAMKMCEDFDHPWVVVGFADSGPAPEPTLRSLP